MEWIACKDKMPKFLYSTYIVCVEFYRPWVDKKELCVYPAHYDPTHDLEDGDGEYDPLWWDGFAFNTDIWEGEEIHVTHWMPLPEPPTD